MPIRPSIAAGVLIAATAATAAGLNLSVMALDRPATVTGGAAAASDLATESGATELPATEVELTSAGISPAAEAAPSVLAVAVKSSEALSSATAARSTDDRDGETGDDETGDDETGEQTVPSTSSPSTTSAPSAPATTGTAAATSSSDSPRSSTTTTATAPQVTEYLTYEFEGVASIIVALHDGRRFEFWSATTAPGWAFKVEDRGPRKVKIKFRPINGGDEAEFELKFEDGRPTAKREY